MRQVRVMLVMALVLGAVAVPWGLGAAEGRPLRVVASFYPMYIATLNVVGGALGVEVINLTPPVTGCLHDYQLRPEDLVRLSRADVFVINGLGMESFLDKAREAVPRVKVINASEGIEPWEDNPHVWLDVSLHRKQVRNIAEGLAAADPLRADIYRAHAGAYDARLADLEARMKDELRDLRTRDMVTFHEAFPYFARAFDLNVAAVVQREPGSEPSASELAETIEHVRRAGVRALFAEPQYPSRLAEVIAQETGAKVYTLDPVVTGPSEADAYLRIMERNAAELRRALK